MSPLIDFYHCVCLLLTVNIYSFNVRLFTANVLMELIKLIKEFADLRSFLIKSTIKSKTQISCNLSPATPHCDAVSQKIRILLKTDTKRFLEMKGINMKSMSI